MQVVPLQGRDLRNPESTGVKREQDRTVPGLSLQGNHAKHVGFIEDALGEAITQGWKAKWSSDIEGTVLKAGQTYRL